MSLFRKIKAPPDNAPTAPSVKEKKGMSNDTCVICGRDTEVPQDTPIEHRKRYVSGSGQLCRDCYFDLYIKTDSDSDTNLNEYEMEWLLRLSRKE